MKIGKLAQATGCKVETVRYYEQAGLLPPPQRSESNYRLYGQPHVERLHFIRHCRALDLSLEEIRVLLNYRDHPELACDEVNQLVDQHVEKLDQQLRQLTQLKQRLLALRSHCQGDEIAESCGILQGLETCSCEAG